MDENTNRLDRRFPRLCTLAVGFYYHGSFSKFCILNSPIFISSTVRRTQVYSLLLTAEVAAALSYLDAQLGCTTSSCSSKNGLKFL
jgi:hypothetical protein